MRHVILGFLAACLLGPALAGSAGAAGSEFDGLWRGKANLNCGARGTIEIRITDGKLSGTARVTGFVHGDLRISGTVSPAGNVKGRAVGLAVLGLSGSLSGEEGRGGFEFDNCDGRWEASLVERAQPVAASTAEPEPKAAPEKQAAPAEPPQRADTTPPTIAVPGEVVADGPTIEISGVIRDDSTIIDARADGRSLTLDAGGRFRIARSAERGAGEITIAAVDEWGNEARRVVRVKRAPPVVPELPPTKPGGTASDPPETVPDASETASAADPRDSEAPEIDVPRTLAAEGKSVVLRGRVRDASEIAAFLVNDRPVPLDPGGGFQIERGVPIGESAFRLAAIDVWGNRTEARVRVTRADAAVAIDADIGRFHALVIGNNDYENMPSLRTAIPDAEAIADVLTQRYGFEVTLLRNATRHDVLKALSVFRKELGYQDNLLIYYAGHGVVDAVTERGYWLPVDAEEAFKADWISNADITDSLKAIGARHVLVVADSCYSGMLTRDAPAQLETWEDRRAWIERVVKKRSRTAFSSGGLEPVADGGGGRHSVFANSLLQVLRENTRMIDAATLFLPVRKQVVLNAEQTPEYADIRLAGHEGGDFVFLPR